MGESRGSEHLVTRKAEMIEKGTPVQSHGARPRIGQQRGRPGSEASHQGVDGVRVREHSAHAQSASNEEDEQKIRLFERFCVEDANTGKSDPQAYTYGDIGRVEMMEEIGGPEDNGQEHPG
jgi:hypothetical protein